MAENIFKTLEENLPSFSKGQKRIAAYIIENCETAALMTASKLGKMVGVSESTVVRFAVELGYDGYPSMQDAMRQMILNRMPSLPISEKANMVSDGSFSAADSLRAEAVRLYQSADTLNAETVAAVVNAIRSAKRIYLLGTQRSVVLAEYARNLLLFLNRDIRVITASGEWETLEQLLYVEGDDALITFGFMEENTAVIIASRYCRSKGAVVISISDSRLSAFAKESNYILVAKVEKYSFGESLVGPMGIIDTLMIELCKEDEELIREKRNALEQILTNYNSDEKRVGRQ